MDMEHGHRKFYEFPKAEKHAESSTKHIQDESYDHVDEVSEIEKRSEELLDYISKNVVGREKVFSGPFGLRKAVYCDYVASGRSLKFIEDYIEEEVLPDYGNTHTTTNVTSLQTTLFRHEARDIIRNAVKAGEHDSVIFVGSGTTAAVHKLIHALNCSQPPVVFVGPFEHHSNLLPWLETGADIIHIKETVDGLVDILHLKEKLETVQGKGRQLIGCFSAASNITGILVDVDAVTIMLHQHSALAVWDYAAAAPYVEINMNPISGKDNHLTNKDAVFFSVHKFIGGVQTPGVLVAKKSLFRNPVPSGCGGGSVFFVSPSGHRYLQETEMREEGGTPAIVESIRAGLVFQLKEAIGSDVIVALEKHACSLAMSAWTNAKNLVLLGSVSVPRLPVFSFLVRHEQSGLFLHYNFVCTLLNDLFGIQARGGCACAGPYAQNLLGIDNELAKEFEDILLEDRRLDRVHLRRYNEYSEKEILRPGFVRLNLPYFWRDDEIQFILDAVCLIAQEGWKLLPLYTFNPETGDWKHRQHQVFKDRKWLGHISYSSGKMTHQAPKYTPRGPLPADFQDCMEKALHLLKQTSKMKLNIADQRQMFNDKASDLRWFLLPSEALLWLQSPAHAAASTPSKIPFQPKIYSNCSAVDLRQEVVSKTVEIRSDKNSKLPRIKMQHKAIGVDRENLALCNGSGDNGEDMPPSDKVNGIEHLPSGNEQDKILLCAMRDIVKSALLDDSTLNLYYGDESKSVICVDVADGNKIKQNKHKEFSRSHMRHNDQHADDRLSESYSVGHCDISTDPGFSSSEMELLPQGSLCTLSGTEAGMLNLSLSQTDSQSRQSCNDTISSYQADGDSRDSMSASYTDMSLSPTDSSFLRNKASFLQSTGSSVYGGKSEAAIVSGNDTSVSEEFIANVNPNLYSRTLSSRLESSLTTDQSLPADLDSHKDLMLFEQLPQSVSVEVLLPTGKNCSTEVEDTQTIVCEKNEDRKQGEHLDSHSSNPQQHFKEIVTQTTNLESSNYFTCHNVKMDNSGSTNLHQTPSSPGHFDNTPRTEITNVKQSSSAPSQERNTRDSECVLSSKATTGLRWHSPPKCIFKPAVEALEEFSMIHDGDQVLVCLSGGKDSLSLLHMLHQYQFYSRKKGIHFKLGAVTIDPQTSSYDPSPLKPYLAGLDVPYFYEEQCIMETAQNLPYECASICSFCSRMKRGRIYHAARREGYNVLALGQHLDDLAESFLMSVFHNGNLRTMKACYKVQEGDLRVIRPFVYAREKDLRQFAEEKKLPVIAENCPACFEVPKERHRMKQLLALQEVTHPRLFPSILSAIKPIFSIRETGVNVSRLMASAKTGTEQVEEEDVDIDEL